MENLLSKLLIRNSCIISEKNVWIRLLLCVMLWSLEFRSIWYFVPCFMLVKVHVSKLGAIRTGLAVSNSKSLWLMTVTDYLLNLALAAGRSYIHISDETRFWNPRELSHLSIFHLIDNVYRSCWWSDAMCILAKTWWSKLFRYGRQADLEEVIEVFATIYDKSLNQLLVEDLVHG